MKIRKTKLYMDTVVDIQVIAANLSKEEIELKIHHAFDAFRKVEEACSRFTPDSELMKATKTIGVPVQISPYLFEPLKFAMEMAKSTDGLFDPTIGKTLEDFGFNRHYLTGERVDTFAEDAVTYRDIILDNRNRTLLLKKPMVIDLGAVAKGFAIDLVANELHGLDGFMVNAGGDLYAGGLDEGGSKWKIDIQHPLEKDKMIDFIELVNEAICTSGSYERKSPTPGISHIVNPNTKQSPQGWLSCSVIAPFAMMADAFSTTAFLLEPKESKEMVEETGLRGIFITPKLEVIKVGVI
jgi:FAD:protein FMN transferase